MHILHKIGVRCRGSL